MKTAMIAALFFATTSALSAERAIELETTVKAAPREAFLAWSTTDGVKTFFTPEAKVESKPGGLYGIYFNPYAPPGQKGADDMRVMAMQQDKMISFTWNAPPQFPEARGQHTLVIVRFAPAEAGTTRVTIHQTGWGDGGDWDKAYDYFGKAWGFVLGNLKKRFEQGPIDWAPQLERLKAATSAAPSAGTTAK